MAAYPAILPTLCRAFLLHWNISLGAASSSILTL